MENGSDSYKTIQESKGIYKEKGSKFLSFLHHTTTEEQAKSIIKIYKNKFHDARHCCYVYKIGEICRSNDDGEPGCIATKAMYSQIESAGVDNILCIVVRYFGGILLGAPGLWNAYRMAVKDAAEKGNIEVVDYCDILEVRTDETQYHELRSLIKSTQSKIIEQVDYRLKIQVYRKYKNLFKKYEDN